MENFDGCLLRYDGRHVVYNAVMCLAVCHLSKRPERIILGLYGGVVRSPNIRILQTLLCFWRRSFNHTAPGMVYNVHPNGLVPNFQGWSAWFIRTQGRRKSTWSSTTFCSSLLPVWRKTKKKLNNKTCNNNFKEQKNGKYGLFLSLEYTLTMNLELAIFLVWLARQTRGLNQNTR